MSTPGKQCDGHQPCSSCIDRAIECSFDPGSDKRRKSHLARDIEFITQRKETLAKILEAARNCDDGTYQQALTMIRAGDPLTQVAQFLDESVRPVIRAEHSKRATTSPFESSQATSESRGYAGSASSALESPAMSGTTSASGVDSIASQQSPNYNLAELPSQYSPQSLVQSGANGFVSSSSTNDFVLPDSRPKFYQERLGELSRRQAGPLSAFPIWHYTSGADSVNLTATASAGTGNLDPDDDPNTWDVLQKSISHSLKYWTSAANASVASVSYLFSLYDTVWGASVYYFIDYGLFIRDMIPCVMSGELGGSSNYYFACDLANALLAVSCFFCTKTCAFADICEPISRGEHFIYEATTQVNIVTQIPCLPSAQSYACLALAEGCRGRLGSARRLWLHCFDMLLSLLEEPRPPREGPEGSTASHSLQQQAQLSEQHEQRKSIREKVFQDQPQLQAENQQMDVDWVLSLNLLKSQIRRTALALGLFCVESMYLTEHNAPDRPMQFAPAPTIEEQMLRNRHESNLEIASHATTTTTTLSTRPTQLNEGDVEMVELIAALKMEMTHHQPPGFLTPEYQDSEVLLGPDAIGRLSQTYPKLGVIYKQLRSLWADTPSRYEI